MDRAARHEASGRLSGLTSLLRAAVREASKRRRRTNPSQLLVSNAISWAGLRLVIGVLAVIAASTALPAAASALQSTPGTIAPPPITGLDCGLECVAPGLAATAQAEAGCIAGQATSPNPGASDPADTGLCGDVGTAVTALQDADPTALLDDPTDPDASPPVPSQAIVNSGNLAASGIGLDADGQDVAVQVPSALAGLSAPSLTAGGATVYPNVANATTLADVLTRSSSLLLTMQQLDALAPSRYQMPVRLNGIAATLAATTRGVNVLNATGKTIFTFTAPAVRTHSGQPVVATLTTAGDALVLNIVRPKSNDAYPLEVSTVLAPSQPDAIPAGGGGNPPCDGSNLAEEEGLTAYSLVNMQADSGGFTWSAQLSPRTTAGLDTLSAHGTNYMNGRRISVAYDESDVYPGYVFHQGPITQWQVVGKKPFVGPKAGATWSLQMSFNGEGQTGDEETLYEARITSVCVVR
jgi:hypothetical protein